MEIIQKIQDTSFRIGDGRWSSGCDGFVITTDKQEIKLGIMNHQSCCENWGYFMSNDYIDDFIGAGVIEVKIVNDALEVSTLEDNRCENANVMFVNIETTNGTLQFTAYNEHNGYYGHDAVVVSEFLNYSESL